MKWKYLSWIIAGIILLVAFLIHMALGIAAIMLLGVLWSFNMQQAELLKKYGPELAQKIRKKQVEIGMSRDVIEHMWGPCMNVRKDVDADGTTLTCDHMPIKNTNPVRYKYYAVYVNDVLMQYGDKR